MRSVLSLMTLLPMLAILPGCGDSKPKPAELPKEMRPLPKEGPIPAGAPPSKKNPGEVSQRLTPASRGYVRAV